MESKKPQLPEQTPEQKTPEQKEKEFQELKKRSIEDLEYTFEYIAEDMYRYGIESSEVPGFVYLAEQIVKYASCDINKVFEGIDHWSNGFHRKYG